MPHDGAVEISEADVHDQIIEKGLLLARELWDAGLAHRDIKPATLMVREGKVLLVDAFLVQVPPSPWRQAVDLGNMILVLAVGSDPCRAGRYRYGPVVALSVLDTRTDTTLARLTTTQRSRRPRGYTAPASG